MEFWLRISPNNPLTSWFLMKLDFFHTTNRTTWYKHWSILFSFRDPRVCSRSTFLTNDTIIFQCLYIIHFASYSGFFISSFISLYSLNTLSIETNLSLLIHELIKALEIKTSIVFDLYFTSNTILLCFFHLVLDNWVIFFNCGS